MCRYVFYLCALTIVANVTTFLGFEQDVHFFVLQKKTICTFISHLQYFIVSFSFCFILVLYCECLLLFAVFRFLSNLSVFNLIFVFRMHFCLRICSLKIHLISKTCFILRCWGLVFAFQKIFQLISLTSRKKDSGINLLVFFSYKERQ